MTKMLLRDVPGSREFVNRIFDAAEAMAAASVGQPDEEVAAKLASVRANLERDLAPEIGANAAVEFADMFCRAVMGEKRERESLPRSDSLP